MACTFLYLPPKTPFYVSFLPSFDLHDDCASRIITFMVILRMPLCLVFFPWVMNFNSDGLKHNTLFAYDYFIERRSIII
jgi:hypothetical protein